MAIDYTGFTFAKPEPRKTTETPPFLGVILREGDCHALAAGLVTDSVKQQAVEALKEFWPHEDTRVCTPEERRGDRCHDRTGLGAVRGRAGAWKRAGMIVAETTRRAPQKS